MASSNNSLIVSALVGLVGGFAGAALFSLSGFGHQNTREYLLENPDILPEMAEALQKRQGEERLAQVSGDVFSPFPGAVLGNPQGKKVLVEFSDYGCTFCRRSIADLEAMVAADPDLQIVIREWPIFEGSDTPARMALAAAKQGKFREFHLAMFEQGSTSHEATARAAEIAGLDMVAAQDFATSREADFELMKNRSLAQQLGFEGTPSWVAGNRLLFGAVGRSTLEDALDSSGS